MKKTLFYRIKMEAYYSDPVPTILASKIYAASPLDDNIIVYIARIRNDVNQFNVVIFDVRRKKLIKIKHVQRTVPYRIEFSRNGKYLIIHAGLKLVILNASTLDEIYITPNDVAYYSAIIMNDWLIWISSNSTIEWFNLSNRVQTYTQEYEARGEDSLLYINEEIFGLNKFIEGTNNNRNILEIRSGDDKSISMEEEFPHGTFFISSYDGELICASCNIFEETDQRTNIKILQTKDLEEINNFNINEIIYPIQFHPTRNIILYQDDESLMHHILNIANGDIDMTNYGTAAQFSASGKYLYTHSSSNNVIKIVYFTEVLDVEELFGDIKNANAQ